MGTLQGVPWSGCPGGGRLRGKLGGGTFVWVPWGTWWGSPLRGSLEVPMGRSHMGFHNALVLCSGVLEWSTGAGYLDVVTYRESTRWRSHGRAPALVHRNGSLGGGPMGWLPWLMSSQNRTVPLTTQAQNWSTTSRILTRVITTPDHAATMAGQRMPGPWPTKTMRNSGHDRHMARRTNARSLAIRAHERPLIIPEHCWPIQNKAHALSRI